MLVFVSIPLLQAVSCSKILEMERARPAYLEEHHAGEQEAQNVARLGRVGKPSQLGRYARSEAGQPLVLQTSNNRKRDATTKGQNRIPVTMWHNHIAAVPRAACKESSSINYIPRDQDLVVQPLTGSITNMALRNPMGTYGGRAGKRCKLCIRRMGVVYE